jgi:hypothetical protein
MVGRLLTIGVFALSVVSGAVAVAPTAAHADGVAVAKSGPFHAHGWQVAYPGDEPFGGRLRPSRSLFSTYTSTAYDCGYYPVTKRRHGEVYVRWVRRCQLF